jgi:hypothetical protein
MAANNGKLERGQVYIGLIQDIALGDYSQVDLAHKYDVTQASISQFKTRHAGEIERLRSGAIDALTLLWVTDKARRIAAYQALAEDAQEATQKGDYTDQSRARRDVMRALRSAAEELPDGLPARTQVQISGKVEYVVNGADPSAFA